jgi:hypothetical protein
MLGGGSEVQTQRDLRYIPGMGSEEQTQRDLRYIAGMGSEVQTQQRDLLGYIARGGIRSTNSEGS